MINLSKRLASLVKELRGDKSQRKFAKALGVSYAAVRSWEESESMPGLSSLEKIAAYSNQSLEEVLEYINQDNKNKSENIELSKACFAEDLIPALKKLPKKEQTKLAQFLITEISKRMSEKYK